MTVLVTGASGFVGLNIVEHLLAADRTVVAFSDRAVPDAARQAFAALPGALIERVGDIRDTETLRAILAETAATQVIHGAVITSGPEREKTHGDLVAAVNIGGPAAMAQAAAEAGVARFVLIGSGAVYGRPPRTELPSLDEGTPHRLTSLYAIGKSTAEQVVARIADLHGMDHVLGRLGLVFGPWEHPSGVRDTLSPIHQVMAAAEAGQPVHLPRRALRNWCYSRQAAERLVTLLDAPALPHRVYNLGADLSWDIADWCQGMADRADGFAFEIGADLPDPIDLYEDSDSAPLASARFIGDFGPGDAWPMKRILDDYLGWIARHRGWGVRQ